MNNDKLYIANVFAYIMYIHTLGWKEKYVLILTARHIKSSSNISK